MKRKGIILICFALATAMLIFPIAKSGYYFIKGLMAFRNGFEGQSVGYLEKSVKTNPNFLEAYMLLALAYAEWASSSMHYMEYDEEGLSKLKSETLGRAEAVLKNALEKFPFHHFRDDIQYMLGRVYDRNLRNSGYVWDRGKAIQNYRQLVAEYPNSRHVQKARKRIEELSRLRVVEPAIK